MADQIEMAIIHMSGAYLTQDFYRKSFGCPDEAGRKRKGSEDRLSGYRGDQELLR